MAKHVIAGLDLFRRCLVVEIRLCEAKDKYRSTKRSHIILEYEFIGKATTQDTKGKSCSMVSFVGFAQPVSYRMRLPLSIQVE